MGQGSGAEDLGPWTLALEPWIADFGIQLLYLGPRIGVTWGFWEGRAVFIDGAPSECGAGF